MALQDGVELAEAAELFLGEEAQFAQHTVIAGRGVALAQHKAVTVRIVGILRVHTHLCTKRGGHQFNCGQRATGVAATGVGRHVDDIPTYLGTEFCQILGRHIVSSIFLRIGVRSLGSTVSYLSRSVKKTQTPQGGAGKIFSLTTAGLLL